VNITLIGAGMFGAALIGQAPRVPQMRLAVVCDLDPERALNLCIAAGFEGAAIAESAADGDRVVAKGGVAIVADAAMACAIASDVVVEATGHASAAAENALAAINAGRHVAMVTKETESVVGPELNALAVERGVVYTTVDGDQPSLLIGLMSRATSLGLEIVCAGKSSEYDFVFDPEDKSVNWLDRKISVPELSAWWHIGNREVATVANTRSSLLDALPQRTVPDLTEMGVVCNATGITPDTPPLHLPLCRTVEIPDMYRPAQEGGLLQRRGVIDVFNCLRRPDEASFAGGVFVVVACNDRDTWHVLKEKGHPVSACGGFGLMYNPQHLLGLEAPTTLLQAGLLGQGSQIENRPVCDVQARAERDFSAGETLTITNAHHHEVDGLTPLLAPANRIDDESPLPYYLATDRLLKADLKRGDIITAGHVERLENDNV